MVLPYWPEPILPDYKVGSFGRWSCERTPHMKTISAGYFLPVKEQPPGWMFKRDDVVWMSLTRMEVESQALPIWRATGHTLIAGLGMGFALYNIMRKPDVSKITLLEKDLDVITLMDRVTDWRNWPGNEKVELVIGNALTYHPDQPVDFLYADIWPKLGDDNILSDTQKLQANINATKVHFWGQELDFIDWCRGNDIYLRDVNNSVWRRYIKAVGLPLLEQHNVIYPRLAVLAATLMCISGISDKEAKRKIGAFCNSIIEEDPLNDLLKINSQKWLRSPHGGSTTN